MQVSALIYLPGSGGRAARRKRSRLAAADAGRRRYIPGVRQVRVQATAGAAWPLPSRPRVGLGDGQDTPGGLGGDGRVRPVRGAGFCFTAFCGALSGGGVAGVGRIARWFGGVLPVIGVGVAGAGGFNGLDGAGWPVGGLPRCRGGRAARL